MKNDCYKSFKTTSKARYSDFNLQHQNAVITVVPSRSINATQNIIRSVLQSELNDPLSILYKRLKENITIDSKGDQAKESSTILKKENNEFLDEKVSQQFSNYVKPNSKRKEKLDVLSPTSSQEGNKNDLDENTFSNFFDSLLSLLSYLNPKLVNALNASIKKFQEYSVIKRDSMNNISPDTSDGINSTLKAILCNCDYCRTGKPDTVLYIVSGKKLNNSVTYHKLTSINRSKSNTSSRYQLRTTDNNSSHQALYLPANYKKPIFGNSLGAAINEKLTNDHDTKNGFNEQLPMMKLVPVSRYMGMKYIPAGLKDNFYKLSNDKFNESLNIPFRKVIGPKVHKYKPIFYFGNNPFLKHTDAESKKENQYDTTHYNTSSIGRLNFLYQSTIEPIEFGHYRYNCRSRGDFDEKLSSFRAESTKISTFENSTKILDVAEVNTISMNTSEEKSETNSNHSLVKYNEKMDTQIPTFDKIEVLDMNAEPLTTEPNLNIITFHPSTVKVKIDNNYLKNTFHKKDFKKILMAAVNDRNFKYLPTVTKTPFKIDSDINENYKYALVTHEMNTFSNEQNHTIDPLEKSIADIVGKLLDEVQAQNSTVSKPIETAKNVIILSGNDGNNSNNNNKFKNISISKQLNKSEYSTALSLKSGLFDSTSSGTYPTMQPSVITILTTTIAFNTSVNKIEPYVNYDLYLRNLIGESNIDEKVILS